MEAFGSLGSSVRLRGLASLAPLTPLLPGPLWVSLGPGTFLGPQEALRAFRSLRQPWVFSQTQRPCFPCSPHPLAPWASLGPWDLPGASGSLGSLWQPWIFSQTQGPCFPCSPHSLSPLSLPGPLGPSWGLRKPWEPSQAFGSLGSSVRLRSFTSLAPPHPPCSLSPLSLPGPPWAPGTFLGPQEALGALRSLLQPWVFSQTQGPCFPYPLTPSCSPLPPEPLGPCCSLRKPWEPLEAFSSLGCFCPKIFWPMVGTYKGLLRLCEWTLGGDCTSRWWGHINTICHH